MGVAEKHGFEVQPAQVDSEAVKFYIQDHLTHFNYPPDVVPSSTMWFGICRDGHVWGVLGLKPLADKVVEIPDFYLHRSRWGILAGYAALEILKEYAEKLQIEVITATPVWNTKQMKAVERVFGLKGPTHCIYRFRPWEKVS